MKLNRLLQTLIPAAIAIWVPASLWAAAFGGFGDSLDQAKGTHFFQWFHLTQTAQEQAAGSTVTSFKPSGKRFRDLVTFKVTTGRKGDITGMELILSRKFVDSPQDGIFARDIAKSLLRTPLAPGLIMMSGASPLPSNNWAYPPLPSSNTNLRSPPKFRMRFFTPPATSPIWASVSHTNMRWLEKSCVWRTPR